MIETHKKLVASLNILHRAPAQTSVDKPPVLLVHGAWHGAWCWEGNYLNYFSEAGHETWALDLRGHGESLNPKPLRLTTIGDFVKDVAAVISHMPAPPIVIGHSMGGFICQHLLNKQVNVKGFGFLASLPHYGVSAATMKVHPLKALSTTFTWSLYAMVSNPEHAKHMFLEPDANQETIDRLIENLSDEAYFAFLGMLAFALPKAPKNPSAYPMCLVGGGADTIVAVKHQIKLAERLNIEPHILADQPHNLMMSKQWQASAEIFLNWINNIG